MDYRLLHTGWIIATPSKSIVYEFLALMPIHLILVQAAFTTPMGKGWQIVFIIHHHMCIILTYPYPYVSLHILIYFCLFMIKILNGWINFNNEFSSPTVGEMKWYFFYGDGIKIYLTVRVKNRQRFSPGEDQQRSFVEDITPNPDRQPPFPSEWMTVPIFEEGLHPTVDEE